MENFIVVEGASENNLKNVRVQIPHDDITLVCGPSGSGKTTLTIDVIHAESQRSYFQTFSSYARQFLERIARPAALRVDNLRCSICVKQGRSVKNNRSTVGSFLGVLDHLKVLYNNFADFVCRRCGGRVESREPAALAVEVIQLAQKSKGFICGRLKHTDSWDTKQSYLLNRGFFRVLIDKKIALLEDIKHPEDNLLILIERFSPASQLDQIKRAIELAFAEFEDSCVIVTENEQFEITRSPSCPCGETKIKRSESLFDASSSFGACTQCKGFGYVLKVDLQKLVDPSKPVLDGGLIPISYDHFSAERSYIRKLIKHQPQITWNRLPEDIRKDILENPATGILSRFKKLEKKKYLPHIRSLLSRFRTEVPCEACLGTGVSGAALDFKLENYSLRELFSLEIDQVLQDFVPKIKQFESCGEEIKVTIEAFISKLFAVSELKIGHLKFSRKLKTLSGGEFQRLNIATSIGNPLTGLQYILDEPSSGLHHRDNEFLGIKLRELASKGNTIILIEHDPYFLKVADYVVQLGPGSGAEGGQVVFAGRPDALKSNPFATNAYKRIVRPIDRFTTFDGLTENNVINQSVKIAEGGFNVICGVSGSGKSTLLRAILDRLNSNSNQGMMIDQKFVAKNSRSTVASYLGIWGLIRDEFHRKSGISKSYFSFNVASEGRCNECKGLGYIVEDLQFLPDMKLICPACEGRRYAQFILDYKIDGKNIVDILNLTISEASSYFHFLSEPLQLAITLGLGHLRLGQTLSEVSVGEAQRLKLIRWMNEETAARYVLLDEPTCGLHPQEVGKLIEMIDTLISRGKTVIVAEHHLELIQNADHIIEMGPGGGSQGGRVIFQGSFDQLKDEATSTALAYGGRIAPPKTANQHFENCLHVVKCKHRNLDISNLKIPYGKFVVVTGASGAGKSSLVFETIAAESERLFLSNLSPYTLSFLDILPKPTGAIVKNLKPVLRLEQYFAIPSSLSSVGTLTDILSYIRLLYAKRGEQLCPTHKVLLRQTTVEEIVAEIRKISEQIFICGSLVNGRKGAFTELLNLIHSSGATGALIDGVFVPSSMCLNGKLDKNRQHYIDAVTAIVQPRRVGEDMLKEAVLESLKFNTKVIKIFNPETRNSRVFNLEKTCPYCGFSTRALDPQDFSFSSVRGRCSNCEGAGVVNDKVCRICAGSGVGQQALSVKFSGMDIAELSSMKLQDLLKFFRDVPKTDKVVSSIIEEIIPRLESLVDLGLGYLSLGRRLVTLSSGELQRVRLSNLLTTGLRDVILILDEPTASLHPREVDLVLEKVKDQVDEGNSVIIIEHDRKAIEAADHIVELGPGGGREGGKVVFEGNLADFRQSSTLTAKSLREVKAEIQKHSLRLTEFIEIKHSRVNNLMISNLKIPLNSLVVICGRSGSGKSSLAKGTIYAGFYNPKSDSYKINVPKSVEEAVYVDQTLISKNSRSTPATYLKIFDEIRVLFARSAQARALGLTPSSFSFNNKKSTCKSCLGLGFISYQLGFLREERVTCTECKGARFSGEVLNARFKGLSIKEVLDLTFHEAFKIFSDIKKISRIIQHAIEIGLGYLTLGQPLSSLSGGENQRLKLLKYFTSHHKSKILFILDEPTLGLHMSDVPRLVSKLRALVDKGHSVIIVEHDETIINAADYVIEMGPGPGDEGGRVMYAGKGSASIATTERERITKTPSQELL